MADSVGRERAAYLVRRYQECFRERSIRPRRKTVGVLNPSRDVILGHAAALIDEVARVGEVATYQRLLLTAGFAQGCLLSTGDFTPQELEGHVKEAILENPSVG